MAVTYSEDRSFEFENSRLNLRCSRFIYATGSPGQYNPGMHRQFFWTHVRTIDLCCYTEVTQPPSNQMAILSAEIDNRNSFLHRAWISHISIFLQDYETLCSPSCG